MIKNTGIIRNRMHDFLSIKGRKKITKKRYYLLNTRFSKQALRKTYQQQDFVKSPLVELTSKQQETQMKNINQPSWFEDYKLCTKVLEEVDQIINQILRQQAKKMRTLDDKKYEDAIQKKVNDATKKITFCQKTLKNIQKFNQPAIDENNEEKRVFTSMIMSLALQVRERAKKLRGTQQSELHRAKQLQKYTEMAEIHISKKDSQQQTWFSEESFQKLEEKMLQQRNKQILKIVQSVHSLNSLYKQLQELVIEQGTILDRIDYNLEAAHSNIKKANQHLVQAETHQNSPCAKRVRNILLIIIFVFAIILLIKYT